MTMNKHNVDKIKISLFQTHFARIHKIIWYKLGQKVGNRTQWIKNKCEEQFGISLESKEDIKALDKALNPPFYEDKSDWLREKIREELKE